MHKKLMIGTIGIVLMMLSTICLGAHLFDQKEWQKKANLLFSYGEETLIREVEHGQWITDDQGRTKIRNRIVQYQETMQGPAADLVNGVITTTMNCNLDENWTGPCWGAYQWPISATEKWAGVWEGTFNFGVVAGSYHASGHGEGGKLAGLRLDMDTVYPGYPKTAVNFVSIIDMEDN